MRLVIKECVENVPFSFVGGSISKDPGSKHKAQHAASARRGEYSFIRRAVQLIRGCNWTPRDDAVQAIAKRNRPPLVQSPHASQGSTLNPYQTSAGALVLVTRASSSGDRVGQSAGQSGPFLLLRALEWSSVRSLYKIFEIH